MIYSQVEPFSFSTESKTLDSTVPLNLRPILPLHSFKQQFKHNFKLQNAIDLHLRRKFSHYVPIRGDGNCAYRATQIRYFELLLASNSSLLLTDFIANCN